MPPGGAIHRSAPPEPDDAAIAEVMKQPEFKRFVEAQQTWDRAFAQGIVDARRKYPNATIVAVLGSGHVAFGYGAPHQLKDLGMKDAVSLIPVPVDTACTRVGKSFANAMFTRCRRAATRRRRWSGRDSASSWCKAKAHRASTAWWATASPKRLA